jgi:hypothetical protein
MGNFDNEFLNLKVEKVIDMYFFYKFIVFQISYNFNIV